MSLSCATKSSRLLRHTKNKIAAQTATPGRRMCRMLKHTQIKTHSSEV